MNDLRSFADILRTEWRERPTERWAPLVGLALFGALVALYFVAVGAGL